MGGRTFSFPFVGTGFLPTRYFAGSFKKCMAFRGVEVDGMDSHFLGTIYIGIIVQIKGPK